jgi:hypothetical protein
VGRSYTAPTTWSLFSATIFARIGVACCNRFTLWRTLATTARCSRSGPSCFISPYPVSWPAPDPRCDPAACCLFDVPQQRSRPTRLCPYPSVITTLRSPPAELSSRLRSSRADCRSTELGQVRDEAPLRCGTSRAPLGPRPRTPTAQSAHSGEKQQRNGDRMLR